MNKSDSTPIIVLIIIFLLGATSARAETTIVEPLPHPCPPGYIVEYATKAWEKTICYSKEEEKIIILMSVERIVEESTVYKSR